ncbi:YceI family protein [Rhodanobacter sp. L36]|uniref:YceI family protein n=1 Tax=Rhodanobacter sp. L36 TaxID=1747221 RepID=UPI0020B116CD|nr:YceI family protein [Rhodanobacter sp. L36]
MRIKPATMKTKLLLALLALAPMGATVAASATYTLDPNHTYPSFEADHMGGVSVWRGKLNHTTGKVVLDKQKGSGTLHVDLDLSSIDFGQDKLNAWATSKEFFDIAKYPDASYNGQLAGFVSGAPTRVDGQLTLHGVTKPVSLTINSFKCIPHPLYKRELCGADALAHFNRADFGLDMGKSYGFSMDVTLRIQVEGLKDK